MNTNACPSTNCTHLVESSFMNGKFIIANEFTAVSGFLHQAVMVQRALGTRMRFSLHTAPARLVAVRRSPSIRSSFIIRTLIIEECCRRSWLLDGAKKKDQHPRGYLYPSMAFSKIQSFFQTLYRIAAS